MNYLPKVLRSSYKKLKQGNLAQFAKAVLNKMSNNALYIPLEDILNKLTTTITPYEAALALAEDRGKQQIADKNLAKATLIEVLDELSDGVDFFGKKNLAYFLGTGLPLQTKKTNHSGVQLLVPTNFVAESDGQPMGVQVSYGIEPLQKNVFKMVGYEWSLDQQNWNNGDYASKRKFNVTNMPSNQKIFVRIRAIGTDGRKSPWTEPVQTSVL